MQGEPHLPPRPQPVWKGQGQAVHLGVGKEGKGVRTGVYVYGEECFAGVKLPLRLCVCSRRSASRSQAIKPELVETRGLTHPGDVLMRLLASLPQAAVGQHLGPLNMSPQGASGSPHSLLLKVCKAFESLAQT